MKYFILFCTLFFCDNISAQKHDYIWHFGMGYTQAPAYALDFNYPNDSIYVINRNIRVGYDNASICDTAGNLLCYTNGISIQDSSHQTMLNGDSLNPGVMSTGTNASNGYSTWEGVLFLPNPNHDSIYQLFHIGITTGGTISYLFDKLYITTININRNGGKGEVISKNHLLLEDSLYSELEAVKHGNGRDWWIIVPEAYSYGLNGYYRFLLTPDSIYGPYYQQIGFAYSDLATGQSTFSPDGTKYARYSVFNDLDILDFDRCTGLFSNCIHISIADTADLNGGGAGGGVAFSPSSRFLYVSSIWLVYQYDMWASNIPASKDTVAIYDGFYFLFPQIATNFFLAQLAPNGKIYLCSTAGGIPYLHLIHNPNSAGQACNFEQHGVEFPSYSSNTVPNFAHYRTPALAGLCDTALVVRQVEEVDVGMKVYPNPTDQQFRVEWDAQEFLVGELVLIDAQGKIVYQEKISKNTIYLDIATSQLPTGIYLCKLQFDDRVSTQKVVIAR